MNTETGRKKATPMERYRLLADVQAAREAQWTADQWVVKRVQLARAAGCSWTDIGSVFGVSRSAVYQRFGHLPPVGYIEPPLRGGPR